MNGSIGPIFLSTQIYHNYINQFFQIEQNLSMEDFGFASRFLSNKSDVLSKFFYNKESFKVF